MGINARSSRKEAGCLGYKRTENKNGGIEMKQEYLVQALEVLEEEARKNGTAKIIHGMIEPRLYKCSDTVLQPIADKKKTYSGAISEMEKYARANKSSNVGVVPPDVAEGIITKYFGIDSAKPEKPKAESAEVSIFDLM